MGSEIEQIAGQIVAHPRYQRLRNFEHHGPGNTVYDHSIAVAEVAYAIARRLRLTGDETASVVRAALLHDFFGYDWHSDRFRRFLSRYSGWQRIVRMHGFVHGYIAADRAARTFGLSPAECEAIARHMFPLAPMPRTRIAWIVTLADKLVATREVVAAAGSYLTPNYLRGLPEL